LKEIVTLEYDRGLRALPLGAVMVLLVTMLSVLVFIHPDPEGYPEGVWIFLVFIFIGIVLPWLLFIEVFGTRAVLNGDGIRAESWWRGTRFLSWHEIKEVYYSSCSGCVILKGGQRKIRINPWMSSIHQLLTSLNEMVPEERIQKSLEVFVRHLRLE
jgi:hypothetical protein